jgi:Subtilase family
MDPDGDPETDDQMDVINMSLGSDEGYPDDPSAVAAANAASIGILVCSAAGNPGDSYYSHSSPAIAGGTLSVAATFNDQAGFVFDATVTGNAPPAFAGQIGFSIYTTTSPHTSATGDVVYAIPHDGSTPLTNAAQCVGKIVLVDRVPGQGANASVNCQNAGAIGILDVADNIAGGDPFLLTTSPALTKPMVVIPTAYGNALKAAAGFDSNGVSTSSPPVNVTIAPGNGVITHGGAAPDTVPTYSARGPGLPDSGVKPDLSAPAEVTGVATNRTGTSVRNFNGTSSATPHVTGMMALLRQFHPTWSVQDLNALACNTATHDVFTTTAATTQYGVGRIGAGRIDLTNAANANVVAFNGSDLDSDSNPNLIGVSFGVVETPVDGSRELTKDITVKNNGTTNVTYNLTIENNPSAPGASFSFTGPSSFTVNGGGTATIPVKFSATGSALRHAREASVAASQGTVFGTFARHWLTEAAGYVKFTPTDTSPVLRVAVYAAAKPVSAMHTTATPFVVQPGSSGTVQLLLDGTPVNTGSSVPPGIVSAVKPFELQYVGTGPSTDANKLRYVGVMSDFGAGGNKPADTTVTFALEGFGNAAVPEFNSSDKEIFIDTNHDNNFDFAIFLSSLANATTTSHTNVYAPFLVDLHMLTASPLALRGNLIRTNVLSPAARDTNSFNNSAILIPLPLAALLPAPAPGGGAPTQFRYVVATFDRNGDQVDQTPLLSYDVANAGFGLAGGHVEPFLYSDLPATSIPVQFNAKNFKSNGSRGVWLVHMHNGDGLRSDVVPFTTK